MDPNNQSYPSGMSPGYPVNNTTTGLMTPQYPPPLFNQNPAQLNINEDRIVEKIIQRQESQKIKQEVERLKEEKRELQNQRILDELKHNKEMMKEMTNANKDILLSKGHQGGGGNTNVVVIGGIPPTSPTPVVIPTGRLKLSSGYYCLFLCLNIFLPGIGTIIAGALFGSDTDMGNRSGEVICHGVVQFLTSWLIFGWVWAIMEASRYFEPGVCF